MVGTSLVLTSVGHWASFVCLIFSTIFLMKAWLLFSFLAMMISRTNHRALWRQTVWHHQTWMKNVCSVLPHSPLTLWFLWAVRCLVLWRSRGRVPGGGWCTALHTQEVETAACLLVEMKHFSVFVHLNIYISCRNFTGPVVWFCPKLVIIMILIFFVCLHFW